MQANAREYAHGAEDRPAIFGVALESHSNFDVDIAISSYRVGFRETISDLKNELYGWKCAERVFAREEARMLLVCETTRAPNLQPVESFLIRELENCSTLNLPSEMIRALRVRG
jgi:hypothetical protein